MNILMVNTYHYLRGGDSRHALEVSARLAQAGHQVIPFAMRGARNLPSPYDQHFVEELDFPRLASQGGLRSAMTVVGSSIYRRQARRRLRGLLDRHPVEVAHLHSVMHHLTASVVLELYRRRIPVVWTLHDLKSVCPTTRMLRQGQICEQCRGGRFHRALVTRCKRGSFGASAVVTAELYLHRLWRIYERADVLIAPSAFLRDKILEHGLRPRRVEVLPNPVEADAYGGPGGDAGYVLFVGRLDPEKGVRTLVEAAVRSRVPLKVVGSGELEPELRREADAANWPNVEFLGHREGDELRQLYRNARLVAVPSEWYENCPLVVLEAFASGKPVLASRLGGLPELVEDGHTGRLLPAGDIAAWSAALAELGPDAERCAAMGAHAQQVVRERHSADAHNRRLLELYAQARAGRS